MKATIELLEIYHNALVDTIQYLDRINHSDTHLRHKVDVALNHSEFLNNFAGSSLTLAAWRLLLAACSLGLELLTIANGPGKPGPLVLLDVYSRNPASAASSVALFRQVKYSVSVSPTSSSKK